MIRRALSDRLTGVLGAYVALALLGGLWMIIGPAVETTFAVWGTINPNDITDRQLAIQTANTTFMAVFTGILAFAELLRAVAYYRT